MKLSFRFCPKLTQHQLMIVEELSYHTTKLYNIANYDCITSVVKSYSDMEKLYRISWHRKMLHSHNYQQCLKVLEQDWKSYFAAVTDYKTNPHKYKGMPKPPGYKNTDNHKNQVIFTNFALRVKKQGSSKLLILSLSKELQSKISRITGSTNQRKLYIRCISHRSRADQSGVL